MLLTIPLGFSETREIKSPRLIIVDARSGDDILELTDQLTINLAALPTRNLNVRLDFDGAKISRVFFGYDEKLIYRIETAPPYFLAGNAGRKIKSWTPSIGQHRIRAKVKWRDETGAERVEEFEFLFKVIEEEGAESGKRSPPVPVIETPRTATVPIATVPLASPRSEIGVLLPTFRINAGGESFIDDTGNFWQSDFGFSAAATFGSSSHVGNILGLGVYHSGRSTALGPLEYHLPVPSGVYRLTTHFMEPYLVGKGKCIFDLLVEGEVKMAAIDPIELAGTGKPLARSFAVSVLDGSLDISFRAQRGFAIVNGLEIQPVISPSDTLR